MEVADVKKAVVAGLRRTAQVTQAYMQVPPSPDSIASKEQSRGEEFAALAFADPVPHTRVTALHYLGSSADHLAAAAAILEEPGTILALLTVLRTQVAAASYAAFFADPRIDLRERVRRFLNAELESNTESMRLIGRGTDARAAEYDRLQERRQQIKTGAAALGWTVAGNDTPKSKAWPVDWYIAPQTKEMNVIKALLGEETVPNGANVTLYRYLSGATHAQPHALRSVIIPELSRSNGDGTALATTGMAWKNILTLIMAAVGAISIALDRCVSYYGWSPQDWQREVAPFFAQVRRAIGATGQ